MFNRIIFFLIFSLRIFASISNINLRSEIREIKRVQMLQIEIEFDIKSKIDVIDAFLLDVY